MLALATTLAFLAATAFARPNPAAATAAAAAAAAAPTVHIKNGTVVGSSSNGVDSFKGIPFAQPPTGSLRLKPPQAIAKTFGTITATSTPTACPQMSIAPPANLPANLTSLLDSFLDIGSPQGEDCLTLNVQRPSNVASDKPLPVLFWIFGGGFEFGSTQSYDASTLIEKSASLGQEVMYVAVNYRVGGFGFLPGKELQKDGSTNLGLRDQRAGLEWVAENIAAFGGDPSRVTIWGESAGSISVFDQMLINRGDNTYNGKPLFHGAIMDSGSSVPTTDVASAKPQAIYDAVVAAAGCSSAADSLACLRALPFNTFNSAVNSVPGIFSYRSLDLSYLPRYDPDNNFFPVSPLYAQNASAHVPAIIGDQEDEGTLFSLVLSNVTTTDDLVTYLLSYFPEASRSVIQGLVDTYPTDPSAGSPFRTGLLNELYPQYKRIAAILGDLTFTLTRRSVLESSKSLAPNVPMWSYLSSYYYGTPILGTFHSTDVEEVYDGEAFPEPGTAAMTYYISFINHLDPNAISTASPLINWPQWTTASPQLINFNVASNQLIPDTFRNTSYSYIKAHEDVLSV